MKKKFAIMEMIGDYYVEHQLYWYETFDDMYTAFKKAIQVYNRRKENFKDDMKDYYVLLANVYVDIDEPSTNPKSIEFSGSNRDVILVIHNDVALFGRKKNKLLNKY